jgi:hypothetical protein
MTKHKYINACPYNEFGKKSIESFVNLDCFSETDIENTQNSDNISYLLYAIKVAEEGFPQKLSFNLCDNKRPPSGAPSIAGCWYTHVKYNVPFIKLIQ